MIVRPWAAFTTDLPEDGIEDDDDFIEWPGRGVTEAIAEMLARGGYQVGEPIGVGERGWELVITASKSRLWARISLIDRYMLVINQSGWLNSVLGRKSPEYVAVLERLGVELAKDARFHDVGWFASGDDILSGERGAPSPIVIGT